MCTYGPAVFTSHWKVALISSKPWFISQSLDCWSVGFMTHIKNSFYYMTHKLLDNNRIFILFSCIFSNRYLFKLHFVVHFFYKIIFRYMIFLFTLIISWICVIPPTFWSFSKRPLRGCAFRDLFSYKNTKQKTVVRIKPKFTSLGFGFKTGKQLLGRLPGSDT